MRVGCLFGDRRVGNRITATEYVKGGVKMNKIGEPPLDDIIKLKEKKIKAELREFNKIIVDLPEEKKILCKGLIENTCFMKVELEYLKSEILLKGYSEGYRNGDNQYGNKQTPESQMYNTMIKNYNTAVKTLSAILGFDEKTLKVRSPTESGDFGGFLAYAEEVKNKQ